MLCRVIDKSGSGEAMRASCKSLRTQLENDMSLFQGTLMLKGWMFTFLPRRSCVDVKTSSSDGSVVFDKPHVYYGMGT